MSKPLGVILQYTALDMIHQAPLIFDSLVLSVNPAVKPGSQSDQNARPIPVPSTRSHILAIHTHVHQIMTPNSLRNGDEMMSLPRVRSNLQQSTHDSICPLYGISS